MLNSLWQKEDAVIYIQIAKTMFDTNNKNIGLQRCILLRKRKKNFPVL